MRAIDTNVLVRLLVRDDPRQLGAAEQFTAKGAWVSHVVLIETLWVLDAVYERSAAQVAAAVELLLAHADLTLQDADVVAAALGQFRAKPTLGSRTALYWKLRASPAICHWARLTATSASCPGLIGSTDQHCIHALAV